MRRLASASALLFSAALAACSGGTAPAPDSTARATAVGAASAAFGEGRGPGRGQGQVTVMTRNLYLGTDLMRITAAASPSDVPPIAGTMWAIVQMTDFPARARLLADEIEDLSPDLVALEEASLYRTGPGAACAGLPVPATTVAIDFLALLQAELASRGLDYAVASSVDNFDGQLCAYEPATGFLDVRLTDRDVILARDGLVTADPRSGHYAASSALPAAGGFIPVVRGWNTLDVKVHDSWLRFAMTHLELEGAAEVQEAQGRELVGIATSGPDRVILAGDFNAGPELSGVTTTYGDLLAAGFRDPWPRLHRRDPGHTCCYDELLLTGTLTDRRDLTLYRGGLVPLATVRFGTEDRTAAGLHPSDHAGVATVFQLRGPGL